MAQEEAIAVKQSITPLIFISHDSRDAELADAFGKLLKSVSAGMLKTFQSSSKKDKEGIEFGEEWFKRIMERIDSSTDVVCLLTKRSLDRPWILFEAGVAKGKLGGSVQGSVQGVALGIPLSRVSASGPFYLFQNNDGSEDDLVKLVLQLCRRIPGSEPDERIVRAQVIEFRSAVTKFLEKIESDEPAEDDEQLAGAKLIEEMKSTVRELSARMDEGMERSRYKRQRRFHPMMMQEMIHMISEGHDDDPIGILMAASLVREDMPWIYEIAREAYLSAKSGHLSDARKKLQMLRNAIEFSIHGPFMEELGKDAYVALREMPRVFDRIIHHQLERMKPKQLTLKRPPKSDKGKAGS